jgi:ATP-dependent protease ClpP protease subunit
MKLNKKTVPWYDMKAQANGEAEITIYDMIGGSWYSEGVTGKQFVKDLKALPVHNTLNIYINSPGGSINEGLVILNALKRHPAQKKVFIDGLAASMASVIAMAGDEIIMPENAMMMIHDPLWMAIGNARDMRKAADVLDKYKASSVSVYRDKTGLDEQKISDLMSAETWMTGKDAQELGFADKVTESQTDIEEKAGRFDLSMFVHGPNLQLTALLPPDLPTLETPEEPPMEITLDLIKNQHATIADALRNEGKAQAEANLTERLAAAKAEGAEAERKRITEIENAAPKGYEAIVDEAKADGKSTAADVALKILAAQKKEGSNYLENLQNEAPEAAKRTLEKPSNSQKTEAAREDESDDETKERCKANWDKDTSLRSEFLSLNSYTAYEISAKKGLSKILRK